MSRKIQAALVSFFLFSMMDLTGDETPAVPQEETPQQAPVTPSADIPPSSPAQPALELIETSQKEINPSGRPQVQGGANLFVLGDYLFWQATEQKLIFAGNIDSSDLGTTAQKGKVQNAKFKWASGFRFGLGYNTCHDRWDTRLIWTWFRDKADGHITGSNSKPAFGAISDPLFGIQCNLGNTDLTLISNLLDLEVGREFCTSNWLALRPFAGLRAGWIHQRWNSFFSENVTSTEFGNLNAFGVFLRQKFWGIGLRAGLDTQWKIISGLSLIADGAVSLLYSTFRDSRVETATSTTGIKTLVLNGTEKKRTEQAIIELQLGLRWDQMVCQDRYHFSFQAGWEHTIFFDHNRFFYFTEGTVESLAENGGNLAFQGLTVSARFDF